MVITVSGKKNQREWFCCRVIGGSGAYCLMIRCADIHCMSFVEAALYDFQTKEKFDFTERHWYSKSKLELKSTALGEDGELLYKSEDCEYRIKKNASEIQFNCNYTICFYHSEMHAELKLTIPDGKPMASSFKLGKGERYTCTEELIPCVTANGSVCIGEKTYVFDANKDTATVSRGSCVFGGSTDFIRGTGSCLVAGAAFGLSITSVKGKHCNRTQNMLFYNGKSVTLGDVNIGIPEENIMLAWRITSPDGSLDMTFTPFFNDRTDESVGVFSQHGDKLYGRLNGSFISADGESVSVTDAVFHFEQTHIKLP